MNDIFNEIRNERERQKRIGWQDEFNTPGHFAAYIANYATRWAIPVTFDPKKYTFSACMIKVAALAVAAIEWADNHKFVTDPVCEAVTPDDRVLCTK